MKARCVVPPVLLVLAIPLVFVSCSRDPNVAKKRYLEMGDTYFKREQYKQASILYRNALQKDQRYGMAHYKLALTYLKLGQPPAAVNELRRAQELLPPNSAEKTDTNVKLAELYIASNTHDKQLMEEIDAVTGDLLKKDPNSFDGHRLAGAAAFSHARAAFATRNIDQGKAFLDTAIAEFRKANAVKPDDRGTQIAFADALIVNRQYPEAEKIYLAIVAKDKAFSPAYVQLYKLYVVQNRLSDAENILKQAYASNPKEYGYLESLAWHYYLTKRRDDMISVLEQIKQHAKEFPDAYLKVGDFYLRLGDSDEAIRQYKQGIVADPKRKSTYQKHEIEVLLRQGNRNLASELNAEILKADPKDTFARGLEAQMMLDKGEIQKAVTELQGVITADPRNFVAHFNLGRAHFYRGEYEQARQQFSEAIRLRPDYVVARVELARLYVTRNDYDAALKAAAEILQIDRTNMAARIIESAALMGMKKYGESRELLDSMLKVSPNSTDALFQLGVVNLAEGKYKEAEEAFRKDYSLEPANARGLMGLVECYMSQSKEDQALQLLETEQQKYPNRTDYHMALGNTAVRAGKYDMAIAEFQKVADAQEKNAKSAADIYLRIGETYRRKGDLTGAVNALQKARNLSPDNTVIIATLALALDSAGQKAQARTAYEQCLKLDPRNGVALNNLAYLLAENNGDLDQALTYAQRAKQLLPALNEVSDTLGWIYLKKQLTDNAVETFKEIVEKQPSHSTYRYHLGLAYAQKGDRLKAIQELNGALKSNPPKDEQDKIRQLLTKLG